MISEVEGMTEINGGPYKIVERVKNDIFCIEADTFAFGDYTQRGIAQ